MWVTLPAFLCPARKMVGPLRHYQYKELRHYQYKEHRPSLRRKSGLTPNSGKLTEDAALLPHSKGGGKEETSRLLQQLTLLLPKAQRKEPTKTLTLATVRPQVVVRVKPNLSRLLWSTLN